MANLLRRLTGSRSIISVDDYINAINQYGYLPSIELSYGANSVEQLRSSFVGYASGGFHGNGVVFACMANRQLVFSAVRFRWQQVVNGKPGEMFGNADLQVLEQPGPGETTQDLLNRIIQDADLAGNSYTMLDTPLSRLGGDTTSGVNLVRLRPDWMEIVAGKRRRRDGTQVGHVRVGYVYTEGGKQSGNDPAPLMLDEVAHFAPLPDPLASFRGMSWLTPVVREIQNDGLMDRHKQRFFENGATPNMIIKHPVGADRNKVLDFQKRLEAEHSGTFNAYKTLNLYPGADATVVGKDMRQLDFKAVQGAGETRIAAAAGVPPVIVGLSEGLQAATYSNYAQARRRFADATIHPLWQNVAGCLQTIVPSPGRGVRLWYDDSNIPFLREDAQDAANIAQTQGSTIRTLIDAGFEPATVVAAVEAGDWSLLKHTGLFSVQLQPPGTTNPAEPTPNTGDTP